MTSANYTRFALHVALLLALAAAGACSGGDSNADESAGTGDDETAEVAEESPVHTYTVRGRVEVLPTEDQERIQIYHEEVSDFVNQRGEVSGMAAMSMPFGVAEGVSLEDISEGDLIEFTFQVDWNTPEVSRVTAIEKLPEDTELELN
jgi:Cu/Ag efflux protein CusF